MPDRQHLRQYSHVYFGKGTVLDIFRSLWLPIAFSISILHKLSIETESCIIHFIDRQSATGHVSDISFPRRPWPPSKRCIVGESSLLVLGIKVPHIGRNGRKLRASVLPLHDARPIKIDGLYFRLFPIGFHSLSSWYHICAIVASPPAPGIEVLVYFQVHSIV